MKNKEKDVHTEHCCIIHGCKYGFGGESNDCTVVNKTKKQSGSCESCREDMNIHEAPTKDGRGINDEDFDLLREIVNKARFGVSYKHLLPEMKKRFDESPEFKRIVGESLGHGE